MANTLDKSELQNSTLEVIQLFIRICVFKSIFFRNYNQQKVGKEPKQPDGRWIKITNTYLLQGDKCNGATGENWPSNSTQNVRILKQQQC
jgi:hypothetical protein